MSVICSPDCPSFPLYSNSCLLLWQVNPHVTIFTGFLNPSETLRTHLLGDEGSLKTNGTTRRTLESDRKKSES